MASIKGNVVSEYSEPEQGELACGAHMDHKVDADERIEQMVRQMRWRCRRGILEVELILQPYFERHARTVVTERKVIMDELLSCADTDLMMWFIQGAQPENRALANFVQEILTEHRA
ncbi:MAG: succinate dehydrogenase assembly factor 2 [Gammaproteobacteria bacterium]